VADDETVDVVGSRFCWFNGIGSRYVDFNDKFAGRPLFCCLASRLQQSFDGYARATKMRPRNTKSMDLADSTLWVGLMEGGSERCVLTHSPEL